MKFAFLLEDKQRKGALQHIFQTIPHVEFVDNVSTADLVVCDRLLVAQEHLRLGKRVVMLITDLTDVNTDEKLRIIYPKRYRSTQHHRSVLVLAEEIAHGA